MNRPIPMWILLSSLIGVFIGSAVFAVLSGGSSISALRDLWTNSWFVFAAALMNWISQK